RDQSAAAREVARPDRRTDAGRRDPGPPRAPRPPDRAQRPVAQEGAGCGLKQPTHVAALRSFTFGIGNADGAGRNCSRCPEWVFTIAGIRRLIRSDEPELTLPPIVLRLGVVLLLLAAVVQVVLFVLLHSFGSLEGAITLGVGGAIGALRLLKRRRQTTRIGK